MGERRDRDRGVLCQTFAVEQAYIDPIRKRSEQTIQRYQIQVAFLILAQRGAWLCVDLLSPLSLTDVEALSRRGSSSRFEAHDPRGGRQTQEPLCDLGCEQELERSHAAGMASGTSSLLCSVSKGEKCTGVYRRIQR